MTDQIDTQTSQYTEVSSPCFLGHDTQYWLDTAFGWLPLLVVFCIFFIMFGRISKRNQPMIERQKQALEELQKMTALLSEIKTVLEKK